ncbi:MAG: thermonuclease family protein [Clostridiales Family XIII bacterium]|jgi:micrococcal nuclease|nr:thermonuclease family protein [Clostridiales Family XIII bacterium]
MKTKKLAIRAALLAVLITIGAAALHEMNMAPGAHSPYDIPATVTRVVDGDTIEVSLDGTKEKVRLIGVDTPESVHPDAGRNVPYGKIAAEFTRSHLEGQTIGLEFDVQERDKYGRLLAYVYVNDVMFNDLLLAEGHARVATYPPNVKYVERFTATQTQARENREGMWGIEPE